MKKYIGDVYGGATAAIVALPLALAFGVSSGAGALAGLYGAIFTGFFAAIFGGTRLQISGPTGPMTVVMALVVTHFSPNLSAAFTVVVLAGIFQILFGILGLGRFIKLMPQPVISGFMSGIGIIIIVLQIAPILGHEFPGGPILVKLLAVPQMIRTVNYDALFPAAITLFIMVFSPLRLTRVFPPALLALFLGSLVGYTFFPYAPEIGSIPSGLPDFYFPQIQIAQLPYIIRFALVLAFLGAIDSLLTSLVIDSITRTSHDSNRELIGQGIGNLFAGLFGGLPGAGATMRSMVNARAGATSRLSGVLHSLLLLLIVFGFSDLAGHIPLAILGGILIKVGINIIDWQSLKRLHRASRAGVVIMLSTLLMTVLVDLITAVAVGFVMASVLFVSRMADEQIKSAKFSFGADELDDLSEEENEILSEEKGRIVLFHVQGPLSFGSARDIAKIIQSDIDKDVLVMDMTDIPFIDSSASAALEEVFERLSEIGDDVLLFGVRSSVLDTLKRTGIFMRVGDTNILASRIEALREAQTIINKKKAARAANDIKVG
ncbi:MAG: SulP family sulfate permease [Planctomycetota bacterium]|jgi:SulP family sulfate permease